jgi:hypothetical protein
LQTNAAVAGAYHEETVDLRTRITAMQREETATNQFQVMEQLAVQLTLAMEVARETSRASMAAAIAREAFTDAEGAGAGAAGRPPLSELLKTTVSSASTSSKIAGLAVALLRIDAEHAMVELAGQWGNLATRGDSLLRRFNTYGGLDDAAQTRLRTIFARLDSEASAGRVARLTAAESTAIRNALRPRLLSGNAYAGGLVVLTWIQYFIGLKAPSRDATPLQEVTEWGAVIHGGVSAARSTFTFLDTARDVNVARELVMKESTILSRYCSGSGMNSVVGGVLSILSGVVAVDEGIDQQNDVAIYLGDAKILSGVLSLLAIGFPALAPIATIVGLGVAAAQELVAYDESMHPYNLRLVQKLCDEALALRGEGEHETIAESLGAQHGLYEFRNQTAQHAGDDFWNALCLRFPYSASNQRLDPACLQTRGNLQSNVWAESFAEEARERLTRALGSVSGRAPEGELSITEVHVRTLLFGSARMAVDPSQPAAIEIPGITDTVPVAP